MGNRLGVAMVTALYPPSLGGIQTHTARLSEKLAKKGLKVTVVTRPFPGAEAFEDHGDLRVYRVGTLAGGRALQTGSYVGRAVQLLRSLRNDFQLMHCHQLLSPLTVGLGAKALTGRALVLNPHACGRIGDVEQLRQQPLFGPLRMKGALRSADAFVAISRPIESELRQLGVDDARLWRVNNGVDVDVFRPASAGERRQLRAELLLEPAAKIVVFCGRLAKEKGVDVLLRAWPEVAAREPSARLVIIGDGPEREALSKLSAPTVRFIGAAAPAAWLRAADAAVLPSRTEGLPVALLEALSCGLPTVATAVGGTPEVMDESMGLLVRAEDPAALGEGLVRILKDAGAATKGARGRERAVARYSLDAIAERYLQLYTALIAGREAESGEVQLRAE